MLRSLRCSRLLQSHIYVLALTSLLGLSSSLIIGEKGLLQAKFRGVQSHGDDPSVRHGFESRYIGHQHIRRKSRILLQTDPDGVNEQDANDATKGMEQNSAEINDLIKTAKSILADNEGNMKDDEDTPDIDEKTARKLGLTESDVADLRKLHDDPKAALSFLGKDESNNDVDGRRALDNELDDVAEAKPQQGSSSSHRIHDKSEILADAMQRIGEEGVKESGNNLTGNDASSAAADLRRIGKTETSTREDDSDANRNDGHPRRPAHPVDHSTRAKSESYVLVKQVQNLTRLLEASNRESARLKLIFTKARSEFQHHIEEARNERNEEVEEMRLTIIEQKRAFDELFREKQLISKVLADEQRSLKELHEKIQHPDLAVWLRQRAERASLLMESPETDAMKYYAQKYMAPRVDKLRHRLEMVEKRIEHTVDHLLPEKYGWFVATLVSVFIVGFPVFVVMSTVVTVSTSMSLKQCVLLGNVFLTAMTMALCIVGIVLRQDPLQTLYEGSKQLFILIQLAIAMTFPCFVFTLLMTTLRVHDRLEKIVFGCQLVFYILTGLNYHSHVWRPAMLDENIQTTRMMYVVFLMNFMSMTVLTISVARVPDRGSFLWDLEAAGSKTNDNSEKAITQSPWSAASTASKPSASTLTQRTLTTSTNNAADDKTE